MNKRAKIAYALVPLGVILGFVLYGLAPSAAINDYPRGSLLESIIFDAPDEAVTKANLDPILTQWGTTQPYTGTGPPGLQLKFETPGDVLDWSLEGWANMTTPPPTKMCSINGVHYGNYDWIFETNSDGASGKGAFTSRPTSIPERLGPDGDQCFARIGYTGTVHVKICVDGQKDGPRGYYIEDGELHYDGWDKCVENDFKVG